MKRSWAGAALVFLVSSIVLAAAWRGVAGPLAARLVEPAAFVLLEASPDVIWSDRGHDDHRVVVLETNERRLLAPMLERSASVAPAVYASLVLAALVPAVTRARLLGWRGAIRIALGALVVCLAEIAAGGLAIVYALAVDNDRTPGTALRLATVTTNAVRAFIPFAAGIVIASSWRRYGDAREKRATKRRGPLP